MFRINNNTQAQKVFYIFFIIILSWLGMIFEIEVKHHPEIIIQLLRNHHFMQTMNVLALLCGIGILTFFTIIIFRDWSDLMLLQSQEPLKRDTLYSMISQAYVSGLEIDEKKIILDLKFRKIIMIVTGLILTLPGTYLVYDMNLSQIKQPNIFTGASYTNLFILMTMLIWICWVVIETVKCEILEIRIRQLPQD